jgi:hypothetical protein
MEESEENQKAKGKRQKAKGQYKRLTEEGFVFFIFAL